MVGVTAKVDNGDTAETCNKDFGKNLDDAIELFTPEVVFANFQAQCIIGLQSFMRNQMRLVDENGKLTPVTGKALQKAVDEWKPGEKKPAKSPVERAKDQMGKLSPEQRAALFAEFQKDKAA